MNNIADNVHKEVHLRYDDLELDTSSKDDPLALKVLSTEIS